MSGAREAAAAEGAAQALAALLRTEGAASAAARANALETVAALAGAGGLGLDAALVADAPAAVVGALAPLLRARQAPPLPRSRAARELQPPTSRAC